MTNAAKKGAPPSETVNEMFHEAMRNYEKALKSGIQLQEESVKLWKDLLTKLGSPEDLQAKLQAMSADVFPAARKRMEEFIDIFTKSSQQTMEMLEKSMHVYQSSSITDAQRRMQDLLETSLGVLRTNVHSALNANAKIMGSWKDLVDRFGAVTK